MNRFPAACHFAKQHPCVPTAPFYTAPDSAGNYGDLRARFRIVAGAHDVVEQREHDDRHAGTDVVPVVDQKKVPAVRIAEDCGIQARSSCAMACLSSGNPSFLTIADDTGTQKILLSCVGIWLLSVKQSSCLVPRIARNCDAKHQSSVNPVVERHNFCFPGPQSNLPGWRARQTDRRGMRARQGARLPRNTKA